MGVTSHHPAPGIQDRGAAAQLPEILGGFRDEPWAVFFLGDLT